MADSPDPKITKTNEIVQLGGHQTFGENNIKCIILSKDNKTLLKLIQPPPRGQKELIFYRHLLRASNKASLSICSMPYVISDSGTGFSHTSSSVTDKSTTTTTLHQLSMTRRPSGTSSCTSYESDSNTHTSQHQPSESPAIQLLRQDLLSNINISAQLLSTLRDKFVPKFYGIKTIEGYDYLEIERIGCNLETATRDNLPSLSSADIKIGRVTYDPMANEAKKKRCMKWPPGQLLGYRYLGIKRRGDELVDKLFCRTLKLEEINRAHFKFLPDNAALRRRVTGKFVELLDELITWFQKQTTFQFYGSSLLFMYNDATEEVDMRMIDFAHVFYEEGMTDENYLFGVKNLRRDFFKLIHDNNRK